jgi:peptidyl-tRNA hydrolase
MVIKMFAIFARETLVQMKYEGKLAAQAGHAFLHAWWDAEERWEYSDGSIVLSASSYIDVMRAYKHSDDARKITLVVDTVAELRDIYDRFRPYMGATLVEDCGYTVFEEPTITCVGLGPIPSDWTKGTLLGDLKTLGNEIHV